MSDTDIERLKIEINASNVALSKSLAVIARDVDKRLLGIEKRTETMSRRVTSSFNAAGRQFSRIGATLFGGAAFVGISRFVSRVVDAAGKIQDTADALGVSTDSLQAWGIMAGRAGVEQETFNTALGRFSKNLGEAQLKGGEFAKLLNAIGVGTAGTAEEVFLRLADAVQATGNQQQKVAITTAALGRSAAVLVPILQQGSAAIRTQTQDLVRNGSVMTRENIAKIDELGDKWADLKRQLQATAGNVLGGFTDEFSKFADTLSSPQFQESLKTFGAVMAQVAVAVAKAAPFLPNIVGALAGARVGRVLGTPGAIGGAVLGGLAPELLSTQTASVEALDKELQHLKATLASLPEEAQVFTAGQINSLEKQIAAARELRRKAADAAGIPFAATGAAPATATGGGIDRTGALATESEASKRAAAEAKLQVETLAKVNDAVREIFKANADFVSGQFVAGRELALQTGLDIKKIQEDEVERARRLSDELIQLARDTADETTRARSDAAEGLADLGLARAEGTPQQFETERAIRQQLIDDNEKSEIEAAESRLARQLEDLERSQESLDKEGEAFREFQDLRVQLEQAAADKIQAIRDAAAARRKEREKEEDETRLQQVGDFFGNLASLSQTGNDTLKAIGKAAAIAQATIDGILAVQKALASAPPPFNFALAASVGVKTAVNIAKIAAMEKGGIVGPGGEVPLRRYARGGVASSPQMALFGEGSMNEAFVPLPDGRRIPVTLKMPELPAGNSSSNSLSNVFHIDARGADEGVAERFERTLDAWHSRVLRDVNRRLPDMMVRAEKRKL